MRRMRCLCLLIVFLSSAANAEYAETSACTMSSRAALLPCLAGWPAPVAAVYEDTGGLVRVHEWRWEPYPVAVAVWSDGTVVKSLSESGKRAPYGIGKVDAASVQEMLRYAEALTNSQDTTSSNVRGTVSEVISVAMPSSALTLYRSSDSAMTSDTFTALRGAITQLANTAAVQTTRTLVFDARAIACPPQMTSSVPSKLPFEVRATWVPRDILLESPEKIDDLLARLADAGFNTVYVAMQSKGFVMYAGSQLLDQWMTQEVNALVTDWFISSAHDKGLRVEAWGEYGFYTWHDEDSSETKGRILTQRPELAAIDSQGRDWIYSPQYGYYHSLCPANPESHQYLIDLYIEMLTLYNFDGINLDRIRFPNEDFCYCPYCRSAFLNETGTTLTVFSAGSREHEIWMKWRENQIHRFVEQLRATVDTKCPGRSITASVVPITEMRNKGQNWLEWLKADAVDAVVPLLYSGVELTGQFDALRPIVQSDIRVVYGIVPHAEVRAQIENMRLDGGRGYAVWNALTLPPFLDKFADLNIGFGAPPASIHRQADSAVPKCAPEE